MTASALRTTRPWVVELIGPAGAGKSTLAGALAARDPRVAAGWSLWGLPRPMLLGSALALTPTFLAAARARRPLRPAEAAHMIRISALHRAVEQAAVGPHRIILMDEGAVFGLTWLEVFFGRNGDAGWAAWRRRAIADWAASLDVLVRVDAPDPVLATRIRTRPQPHMVRHSPEEAIRDFTARFRSAFDRVVGDLRAAGAVKVLRLDTGVAPPADIAVRLGAALEALHEG